MDNEVKDRLDNNDKLNQVFMDKLDKFADALSEIKISIAGLPQAILENADKRYASKQAEVRLNSLETKIENRQYEWLKYVLITVASIVLSVIVSFKLHL